MIDLIRITLYPILVAPTILSVGFLVMALFGMKTTLTMWLALFVLTLISIGFIVLIFAIEAVHHDKEIDKLRERQKYEDNKRT